MKFLSLLGTIATAVSAAQSEVSSFSRILEGENGQSYAYLDDVSGYSLQFGSCVRVKIQNENDDDQEGNGYFFNGSYRAQYMRYATFHLCTNNQNSCDCDYSTQYATEISEFLQTTLNHMENYCETCEAMCGRRRLDEGYAVDCNACSNDCSTFNSGQGNADESDYVECAAGYVDGDGIQYYYGPQCDSNGQLEIGLFYDDECTVKTSSGNAPQFNYYKFQSVTGMCMDCSSDDTCGDLYGDALHCFNGKEASGKNEDNMSVCSSVKKASTSHEYASGSRRKSGADKFLMIFFIVLAISFVGAFLFLSYTYYIRHRGERSLVSQDHYVGADGQGTLT